MAVFLNKTKITFLKDEQLPIESILRSFGTQKQFDKQHQVMKWYCELERQLDDAPPYQREDKADLIWRQGIINSLLVDIPFPDLYWRVIVDVWEVVDGGHRIRTVNMFVLDLFPLPKKYRPVVNGKVYKCDGLYFSQCPQIVQDKILYSNWRVQKFEADDKTTARMFHIINNGNEMTPQEDRQAVRTELANFIRETARGVANKDNQHIIFQQQLVDFKRAKFDWDSALAQCALFESKPDCNSIVGKELDKFYEDVTYFNEVPFREQFESNLDDVAKILKHKADNRVTKNYFVNLYMCVSTHKRNGFIIDDYSKWANQWFIDENERKKPSQKYNISGTNKSLSFCLYKQLTGFEGGKKIKDRIDLIMSYWNIKSYGCVKEEILV